MQPFELLSEGHFEQADFDLWVFLSTARKQRTQT